MYGVIDYAPGRRGQKGRYYLYELRYSFSGDIERSHGPFETRKEAEQKAKEWDIELIKKSQSAIR